MLSVKHVEIRRLNVGRKKIEESKCHIVQFRITDQQMTLLKAKDNDTNGYARKVVIDAIINKKD